MEKWLVCYNMQLDERHTNPTSAITSEHPFLWLTKQEAYYNRSFFILSFQKLSSEDLKYLELADATK